MLTTLHETKRQRKLNRKVLSYIRAQRTGNNTVADYPLPPIEWLVNNGNKTLNPESSLAIALEAHSTHLNCIVDTINEIAYGSSRRAITWDKVLKQINNQIEINEERTPSINRSNRINRLNHSAELAEALKNTGCMPFEVRNVQKLAYLLRKEANRNKKQPMSMASKVEHYKDTYDTMSPRHVEESFLPKGEAIGVEIEWLAPAMWHDNDDDEGRESYYDTQSKDFVYPTKRNHASGLCDKYIHGTSWGYDSSIEINNAEHLYRQGQEVRVMLKKGKWKRLYEVCDYIKSNGGELNKTCGLHIHLDVRDLSSFAANTRGKRIGSALPWLLELVPQSRRNNRYCRPEFSADSKYYAVTTHKYRHTQSIEVRLHSATLNASKIIKWIELLLFLKERYKHISTFEEFLQSDAPMHLKEWAINRRTKFCPVVPEEPETESEQLSELESNNNNTPEL